MKKAISILMVVSMLAAVCCFTVPAQATDYTPTLSGKNVSANALYYDGTAQWVEIVGPVGNYSENDPVTLPTTKTSPSESVITLDGVISEGEWGTPTLNLSSDYAATIGDDFASTENTFFYNTLADKKPANVYSGKGLSYQSWYRWDEDYLYIAALVFDPDGPLNTAGGASVWDGDCLQVRIDWQGPNSAVDGGEYNARNTAWPWEGNVRKGYKETYAAMGNFGFGYTTASDGYSEAYDMALRYDGLLKPQFDSMGAPVMVDALDENGEPILEQVFDELGNPVLDELGNPTYAVKQVQKQEIEYESWGMTGIEENVYGECYCTVRPVRKPTLDNRKACQTTYEVAIPWAYIDGSCDDGINEVKDRQIAIEAGAEFGISAVVFSGGTGGTGYNSYLSWGSGITSYQMDFCPETCGGSNSLILSDVNWDDPSVCAHPEFTAPNCTNGYVCTTCGYEYGFAAGHQYNFHDTVLPTATTAGQIVATCSVCNETQTIAIPASERTLQGEFTTTGTKEQLLGSQFSSWLYLETDDSSGTAVPVFDPDGTQSDNLTTLDGESVIDFSKDHTYYQSSDANNKNYSLQFDYMMTGVDMTKNNSYCANLHNWFGGFDGLQYVAGFFPTDATVAPNVGRFVIMKVSGINLSTAAEDKDIVAQTEEMTIPMNEFHHYGFMYDATALTYVITYDGEVVLSAWDIDFHTDSDSKSRMVITRNFNLNGYVKNMTLGSSSYLAPDAPSTFAVTVDGVEIGQYSAGDTVTLTKPTIAAGTVAAGRRFFSWTVTAGTADIVSNAFSMPAEAVTITSDTILIGDATGDNRINPLDLLKLKLRLSGKGTLTDKQEAACDVTGDTRVNPLDLLKLKLVIAGKTAQTTLS